jgi:hypothetical protein
MTLISTTTLGSNAANIEFTSIPGTYTDLYLVMSLRSDRSGATTEIVGMTFNGSTSSRTGRNLEGNGSSVYTNSLTDLRAGVATGSTATSNTFGNSSCYIPNYAGSTNKSFSSDGVSENNGSNVTLSINAHLWSNTAAITSIQLYPLAGGTVWLTGSIASIYGVLKGSGGATVS